MKIVMCSINPLFVDKVIGGGLDHWSHLSGLRPSGQRATMVMYEGRETGSACKAHSSGFDLVVDLSDVYDGQNQDELAIAPGDYHPNVLGHQLIAKSWADQLAQWPELQSRLKSSGKAP